jgi:hypothetical protein
MLQQRENNMTLAKQKFEKKTCRHQQNIYATGSNHLEEHDIK